MGFIRSISDNSKPDSELLAEFQRGKNLQVLAVLYERYMDLIYGVCLKYLKDPDESKDAVMQIYESLVFKLPSQQVDHFRGWLYVVAKNHCLMALRSAGKMKTSSLAPELMQSGENGHLNGAREREDQLELLEDCMEKLPVEQKRSVQLFYLEQKCYKDIADMTGNDWNKVRSLIQNGRRNLKLCMEKTMKEKTEL